MVASVLKHLEIHIVIFIINIHMIQLIFNLIHLLILQFIYFFLFFLLLLQNNHLFIWYVNLSVNLRNYIIRQMTDPGHGWIYVMGLYKCVCVLGSGNFAEEEQNEVLELLMTFVQDDLDCHGPIVV